MKLDGGVVYYVYPGVNGFYADPSFAVPNTPIILKAHLGRSMGESTLTFGGQNYWDWMVGADVKLIGPLTAGVATRARARQSLQQRYHRASRGAR